MYVKMTDVCGWYLDVNNTVAQRKDRSFNHALHEIDESLELCCNIFWTKYFLGNYWLFFGDLPLSVN